MDPQDIVVKTADRDARPGPDLGHARERPIAVRLSAELVDGEPKEAVVVQDVPKAANGA